MKTYRIDKFSIKEYSTGKFTDFDTGFYVRVLRTNYSSSLVIFGMIEKQFDSNKNIATKYIAHFNRNETARMLKDFRQNNITSGYFVLQNYDFTLVKTASEDLDS